MANSESSEWCSWLTYDPTYIGIAISPETQGVVMFAGSSPASSVYKSDLVSIPCTILSIQSTILYILFYLIMESKVKLSDYNRSPVSTVTEFVNDNIQKFYDLYSEWHDRVITGDNYEQYDSEVTRYYTEENKEFTLDIMKEINTMKYLESICEC